MGWPKPFANCWRSSRVSVFDGSRKTIAAGFPPNRSWVNEFAIANGYVLEIGVEADDMAEHRQEGLCVQWIRGWYVGFYSL